MATSPNPFTGSGWNSAPPNSGGPTGAALFTPPPSQNALLGWPGQNVNQNFGSSGPAAPTVTGPSTGTWGNPANLPNAGSNLKDAMRNAGFLNVEQGQLRNQMIPMFANLMTGYAGPAANFFKTLMNLGSPYYQQKQADVFNQGVQQNQNAAGQTRQDIASRGYGYAPSGLEAATMGGENVAGGANLVQNFLNTLFQNEQLQTSGAQGLSQLASMFNPASLFGGVNVTGSTQGPSASSEFAQILGSIFGSGGFDASNFSTSGSGGK